MDTLAELMRDAEPILYRGWTVEEIAIDCIARRLEKLGFGEHDLFEYTIEDLENLYKKGWAAVIHDGKLLGFRKEKSL